MKRRVSDARPKRDTWIGVVAAILCLAAPISHAQEIQYHGFDLDGTRRIVLKHEDNSVEWCLWERASMATPEPEDPDARSRYIHEDCLIRVRAEVLRPAKPNSLGNAGLEYRITLEGLEVNKGFGKVLVVTAENARVRLRKELETWAAHAPEPFREALVRGGPLLAETLRGAGLFPPRSVRPGLDPRERTETGPEQDKPVDG